MLFKAKHLCTPKRNLQAPTLQPRHLPASPRDKEPEAQKLTVRTELPHLAA